MKKAYRLDTNICSFIMRQRPERVLMKLQQLVEQQQRIVISSITYAEMQLGVIGKKASPQQALLVADFVSRLDGVLHWDREAIDATASVKVKLNNAGTPIGANDAAVAGHAIATQSILVTNHVKEFSRIEAPILEDWVYCYKNAWRRSAVLKVFSALVGLSLLQNFNSFPTCGE